MTTKRSNNASRQAELRSPRSAPSKGDDRARGEDLVRPISPEHVPQPLYGLPRAGCGADHLAGLQGPLSEGGLPCAAVDVVPDRVARHLSGGLDGDRTPDHDPDRFPAHPGYGYSIGGALRTRRLRSLQGKPGRRLPLPLRRRPRREPLNEFSSNEAWRSRFTRVGAFALWCG